MSENDRPRRIDTKARFSKWKDYLGKLKGVFTTVLSVSIIIHIAMVVIGFINKDKCPVSTNIPLFLLASGIIGLVSKILGLMRNILWRYFDVNFILSLIYLVEFVFFICGSVWVFNVFEPKYDPNYGDTYCDRTTYVFSFTYVCCLWCLVFAGFVLFLCLAFTTCVCCVKCGNIVETATEAEQRPLPSKDEN